MIAWHAKVPGWLPRYDLTQYNSKLGGLNYPGEHTVCCPEIFHNKNPAIRLEILFGNPAECSPVFLEIVSEIRLKD